MPGIFQMQAKCSATELWSHFPRRGNIISRQWTDIRPFHIGLLARFAFVIHSHFPCEKIHMTSLQCRDPFGVNRFYPCHFGPPFIILFYTSFNMAFPYKMFYSPGMHSPFDYCGWHNGWSHGRYRGNLSLLPHLP